MHLIEDHAKAARIPVRFAAAKLAEGDQLIMDSLNLDQNEKEMLEHIVKQMETERGLDRAAAIAHMRFDFIEKVCDETVVKPKESKEHLRSMKIDKILTGKYTAIPCFIGIMGLVFFLTFSVIGAFLQNILDMGITALGNIVDHWMMAAGVNDVLHSLVMDGVFNGVGSVLSFLPVIVTLFFFLSLLEDSGYMARVAFVMDKLVPADIQYTSEHCNRFQRQYSGNGGKCDCSDLQTNGIWRLEDFHSSDHWIYGKRERGINTFYPIWKYSGFAWKYYITFRSESSGFLSAVYTLCGSHCFNQT